MYLRFLYDKNVSPIEKISLNFSFNDNGSEKLALFQILLIHYISNEKTKKWSCRKLKNCAVTIYK